MSQSRRCELVLAAYPLLLEGLQSRFKSEPGFSVVSCCTTGAQALNAIAEHCPDVAVLDFQLLGRSAFDVLRRLAATTTGTRVVLLADHIGEHDMLEATRLGVRGIVLTDMPVELLVTCVRKVHAGAVWFERVSTGRVVHRLLQWRAQGEQDGPPLTGRQLEITRLAASGCSNKEIAGRLAICEGTVKAHLHTVYEKLGVGGRVELVRYAHNRDLLDPVGEFSA